MQQTRLQIMSWMEAFHHVDLTQHCPLDNCEIMRRHLPGNLFMFLQYHKGLFCEHPQFFLSLTDHSVGY